MGRSGGRGVERMQGGGRRWEGEGGRMEEEGGGGKVGIEGLPFMDPRYAPVVGTFL